MSEIQPPDHESLLETSLQEVNKNEKGTWERVTALFSSAIGLTLLGFLLTGVAATAFSKWLDNLSKTREFEAASLQRATDSLKSVTEILYERRIRARYVQSSIRRNASIDELKDRKKAYDDIVIRYNTELQSNSFRIREMFRGDNYGIFHKFLLVDITNLFRRLDDCATSAYDAATSSNENKRGTAVTILTNCYQDDAQRNISFDALEDALGYCTYAYADALFTIVQNAQGVPYSAEISDEDKYEIQQKCQLWYGKSPPAATGNVSLPVASPGSQSQPNR
jgi:hypothetical protein